MYEGAVQAAVTPPAPSVPLTMMRPKEVLRWFSGGRMFPPASFFSRLPGFDPQPLPSPSRAVRRLWLSETLGGYEGCVAVVFAFWR